MNERDPRGRRGFLRTALGTAFSGAAFTAYGQSPKAEAEGTDAAQVGRVTLDRGVYEPGGLLNGEIHFVRFPLGPTEVQWIDSFGRVVAELTLPVPKAGASSLLFALQLNAGLAYSNWIRVNETAFPEQTFKVVRLEFETPSGGRYELYARNLLLKSTPHTERIPLACSDPKGRWRAHARDVATGQSQEVSFGVV